MLVLLNNVNWNKKKQEEKLYFYDMNSGIDIIVENHKTMTIYT